eukprot:13966658-Ditylum_brightwellii.AAC.1
MQVPNCTCMIPLTLSGCESVAMPAAQYMVHWAGLSMEMEQEIIHSWTKIPSYFTGNGTSHNSVVYMLPTLALPKKNLWICKNGLSGLLNNGRRLCTMM